MSKKVEFMNVSKAVVLSVVLMAGSFGLACKAGSATVKTTSSVEAVTTPEEITEQTQTPQGNPGGGNTEPECVNPYGTDSSKTREQISLYREQFNNRNYMASIPFWRYVYYNAPCAKEFVTADGAYLMTVLIASTKNKDSVRAYADTLMKIYDDRLRFFGRNANVVGRKGRDMFKYYPDKALEAIQLMKESMEGEGNKTMELLLSDLMTAVVQQNKAGKVTDDEVLDVFDKVSTIVDYNLKEKRTAYNDPATKDTARVGQSMRYWEWVDNYVVDITAPYLTCEKLTQVYQPKFKATPDDPNLLAKIIILLKRAPDCGKTDFYFEVAEQNFKLSPTADAAAALAKAFQDKNNNAKAKTYYEKAAELETDNMKKADYYIVLASMELSNNDCSNARTLARKALELNPKSGEAYLIIGNAYMSCAGSCGEQGKVSAQFPYLAAYDKFVQAKTVDPSVAEKANARMAIAKARFPTKEGIFYELLKEGQTVSTGCWIGETTTLRTSD